MLPLRFTGQTTTNPVGIGFGVVPGDVHNWVVLLPGVGHRSRAGNIAPIGTVDPAPPLDTMDTQCGRSGFFQLGPEHERPADAFGLGLVTGGLHKLEELCIRNRSCRDEEWLEPVSAKGLFSIIGDHLPLGAGQRKASGYGNCLNRLGQHAQ